VGPSHNPSLLVETSFCDSDIAARFADNDGAAFGANQVVSRTANFQYQLAICVEPASGNVVVPHFSA
jgi:hypothetical protein